MTRRPQRLQVGPTVLLLTRSLGRMRVHTFSCSRRASSVLARSTSRLLLVMFQMSPLLLLGATLLARPALIASQATTRPTTPSSRPRPTRTRPAAPAGRRLRLRRRLRQSAPPASSPHRCPPPPATKAATATRMTYPPRSRRGPFASPPPPSSARDRLRRLRAVRLSPSVALACQAQGSAPRALRAGPPSRLLRVPTRQCALRLAAVDVRRFRIRQPRPARASSAGRCICPVHPAASARGHGTELSAPRPGYPALGTSSPTSAATADSA